MINQELTKTLKKKRIQDIIASYMLCTTKVIACLKSGVIAVRALINRV